jgi:hypothetical protein
MLWSMCSLLLLHCDVMHALDICDEPFVIDYDYEWSVIPGYQFIG